MIDYGSIVFLTYWAVGCVLSICAWAIQRRQTGGVWAGCGLDCMWSACCIPEHLLVNIAMCLVIPLIWPAGLCTWVALKVPAHLPRLK